MSDDEKFYQFPEDIYIDVKPGTFGFNFVDNLIDYVIPFAYQGKNRTISDAMNQWNKNIRPYGFFGVITDDMTDDVCFPGPTDILTIYENIDFNIRKK